MGALLFRHRRLILGAVTAVFYGFLAFLANHDKGMFAALKAAIVQSFVSTILVLLSSMLMEYFFRFGRNLVARYCSSLFITGAIAFTINTAAHWLMATPNLLLTLAYAILSSLPYYIIYPYILVKHHLQVSRQAAPLPDDLP